LQLSARGDGLWYVGIDDEAVHVIAPPGVHITGSRYQTTDRPLVGGWRLARWAMRDREAPLVDIDAPSSPPEEISTCEVLSLVGDECAAEVRAMLVSRLSAASSFGEPDPRGKRAPREEQARAGARSVAWLLAELKEAFPEEEWEFPHRGAPFVEHADALLRNLLRVERGQTDVHDRDVAHQNGDADADTDEIACDGVCAWHVDSAAPQRSVVRRSSATGPRPFDSFPPPSQAAAPAPDPPPTGWQRVLPGKWRRRSIRPAH
jgi:hypothetical protein